MKVLVTGGTGTISSGIVKECVIQGYETYAITRGNNPKRNIEHAEYLKADLWDCESIKSVLGIKKFDVIVETQVYTLSQLKISLSNYSEICQQYIFMSTAAIYAKKGEHRIKESDEKNNLKWDYTINKIECEEYLKKYAEDHGLVYTIIRPTVTDGDYRIPFPIATRTPGWTLFQRMLDGKPILASENVKFSIIHIEDFSKSVVELFGNKQAQNEDFHITCNSNDIYWDDVIDISNEILKTDAKTIHVPEKIFNIVWPGMYPEIAYHKNISQVFDDSKILSVTKHRAKIDLKEGMVKTISAMKVEYENSDHYLDENWSRMCDAVIYCACQSKVLSMEEQRIAEEYLKGNFGYFRLNYLKCRFKSTLYSLYMKYLRKK